MSPWHLFAELLVEMLSLTKTRYEQRFLVLGFQLRDGDLQVGQRRVSFGLAPRPQQSSAVCRALGLVLWLPIHGDVNSGEMGTEAGRFTMRMAGTGLPIGPFDARRVFCLKRGMEYED